MGPGRNEYSIQFNTNGRIGRKKVAVEGCGSFFLHVFVVGGFLMDFRGSVHTSALMPFARSRYALFNAAKIAEKY